MKEIELRPALVRPKFADLDVIDNLEEGGRKRCTITVDYSEYDVKSLIREGLDLDGAMDHYKERITYIVRRYLLEDFEVNGGWDAILDVIRPYVEQYYK
ncbi:MAG: hypothetical protein K6B42_05580 [Clostridia bacterium]|nr:hypothetical protein [Clostridia bacterium]